MLPAAAGAASVRPHIDHVMVGVSDLSQGVAEIERLTGVRAVAGGVHPGKGTQNALISLGRGTYLEIIAPNPAEPANSDVRMLRKLKQPTVVGWGVSASDGKLLWQRARAGGERLTRPEPGSRRTPSGRVLRFRLFGYSRFGDPVLWDSRTVHPSLTSPGGCALKSLSIEDPNAAKLRRVIAPLALRVPVTTAKHGRMRVALTCGKRDVTLK